MHFSAFIGLLPFVSAAALIPRATDNTQAILQNITQIETDIVNLNDTVNQNDNNTPYNFFQLGAINVYSQAIATDLNSTAGTANSSTVGTVAESNQVLNEVKNKLSPYSSSLLDNIVRHKPAFDQGGISPTVLSSLQQQRELSRELNNALYAKADPSVQPQAAQVGAAILAKFDSAIKSFGG